VPVEKRAVGEKDIETSLNERMQRNEALRQRVEGDLRTRIAAGFGTDDMNPLAIQLPGAELAPQTLDTTLSPLAPSNSFNNQKNSNIQLTWPSATLFAAQGAPASALPGHAQAPHLTETQQRVAALRRQAWQEATRWAKTIARRQNWALQNRHTATNGSIVPDRTREALQLLDL
jgi:hypothetical protein